jgi:hypothetical protein
MAIPVISSISPATGPTAGGDLARVTGVNFAAQIEVFLGDAEATVISVREESGNSIADIRTPSRIAGTVDLVVRNLDATGVLVLGEEAVLTAAYRFLAPQIIREANLTRLVRGLLRELKKQILANASMTVSVDYDDTAIDGLNVVALSRLPSVVLSGPKVSENRFFSSNTSHEDVVPGSSGPELRRRRPPFTVDLSFTITAASDRTVELLNLMAAVATFLNRNRWFELPRNPEDADAGTVRWEMDPEGDFQTQLDGSDDVRAFSCGFVVRGFDIDEGLPLDLGKAVVELDVGAEAIVPGGTP